MQREVTNNLSRTALSPLDLVGLEDRTADAVDDAICAQQRIDSVAEFEDEPAVRRGFVRPPLERLDNARARAPGDVKTWHRIAMAHRVVTATLGPADHREQPMAHGPQPGAFLAGRKAYIGLRPTPRPEILVAVEACRSDPVLECQVVTVLDAEPALFWGIDQKKPAKRPKRLAAQALFALLLDQDDAFAGIGNFGGGDETRKTSADHDDVSVLSHRFSLVFWEILNAWHRARSTANGPLAHQKACFSRGAGDRGAACRQHFY